MSAPVCPRCKAPMEEGFVIDRSHGDMLKEQRWVEGQAERSVWSGIKTKGRDVFAVVTYRCDRCGFLESYAQTRAKV